MEEPAVYHTAHTPSAQPQRKGLDKLHKFLIVVCILMGIVLALVTQVALEGAPLINQKRAMERSIDNIMSGNVTGEPGHRQGWATPTPRR